MSDSSTSSAGACVIGPKSKIKGELRADEDVRLEGHHDGVIQARAHTATVGASGHLKGAIFAKTVEVEGRVEGDLYALEIIKVRKGAKIDGNLHATRITFEDGAALRGVVEMDPETVKKSIVSEFGQDQQEKPAATTSGAAPKPQSMAGSPASASSPAAPQSTPAAAAASGSSPTKGPGLPGPQQAVGS